LIWKRKDIEHLTITQKEEWFDVYNNGLLEDRNFLPNEMTSNEIKEANRVIREDYFSYLESLKENHNFI